MIYKSSEDLESNNSLWLLDTTSLVFGRAGGSIQLFGGAAEVVVGAPLVQVGNPVDPSWSPGGMREGVDGTVLSQSAWGIPWSHVAGSEVLVLSLYFL